MKRTNKGVNTAGRGAAKKNSLDLIVILSLVEITLLFIPFIILLVQLDTPSGTSIPNQFALGAVLLMAGSWLVRKVQEAKVNDRITWFRCYLLAIFRPGILFLLNQYILCKKHLYPSDNGLLHLFVVMAITHALHFACLMVFMAFWLTMSFTIRSPAELYIYFLRPRREKLFQLTCRYWEYFTILWLAVYTICLLK